MVTLGNIFNNLYWKIRGLSIDGEFLNNLRLADIVHIANSREELERLINEFDAVCMVFSIEL